MLNFVATIIIILIVLWLLCRIFAWVIVLVAKRLGHIDVKIGKVGFFTFGNIQVTVKKPALISVEIEKLWFSSSYFSRETKKALGVCISDARVHIDLPTGPTRSKVPSHENKVKDRKVLEKVIQVLNWTAVHLDNTNLVLRHGPLKKCLLHLTLKELLTNLRASANSLHFQVEINNMCSKLLHSGYNEAEHQPCLTEASLSGALEVEISLSDDIHIKDVTIGLVEPQVRIYDTLFSCLPNPNSPTETEDADTLDMSPMEAAEDMADPYTMQRFTKHIPKSMDIQVENADIRLCRESGTRELHIAIATVQLHTDHNVTGDNILQGAVEFNVKGADVTSSLAHLASMHAVHIGLKADDQSVSVSTQLLACFLGYHHEELHYWSQRVVQLVWSMRRRRPSSPRSGQNRPSLANLIQHRAATVNCQLKNVSAAVAMATCSGVKGGLAEGKFSLSVKGSDRLRMEAREAKYELEVSTVYCKLSEGGAPTNELSSRLHHWNTVFYLGILLVKGSKTCQTSMDVILDSIQLEVSTQALSVMDTLAAAIMPLGGEAMGSGSQVRSTHKKVPEAERVTQISEVNVEVTNVNVFVSYEHQVCTMVRLDTAKSQHRTNDLTLTLQGIKMIYLTQLGKCVAVTRSAELHNYAGHLNDIVVRGQFAPDSGGAKTVEVEVMEEAYFVWSMGLHLCLYQTLHELWDLAARLKAGSMAPLPTSAKQQKSVPVHVSIHIQASVLAALQIAKGHRVTFSTPEVKVQVREHTTIEIDQLSMAFDPHEIITIQGMRVQSQHHSDQMKMERRSMGILTQATNRLWVVSFDQFHVTFPCAYNFAECFEEVKNLNKWRKSIHKVTKKPFTGDSPLPPDLIIKVKSAMVQLSDDPFEVKLGDNYKLLCDEFCENENRQRILERRVQELRKSHGLLPAGKVEELYASLSKKAAELYIQRSRQLYADSAMRTKLWTWGVHHLELATFADPSFHGTENVVRHMREIDAESPYPDEGLEFVTLWCRLVNISARTWTLQLRDYPLPLIDIGNLTMWGRLVGAEQLGTARAKRACQIDMGAPWGLLTVTRNMPALKFYHDFSCDIGHFHIAYGPCWEPCWAQFNQSINLVNRPSVDPSRPLPFWDKSRLLLHGRLTMSVKRMSWIYHASLDPYNTTEMGDWCWSHLILDWTNGKWVLRGDLDIYARTASKYDDCQLLHLPGLRLCFRLDWLCLGDPNDHHAVMPCAPDKVPEYSMQEHDSYRAFRSQNLNMSVSFDTRPSEEDIPSCLFYASTLRWMDKIKMCLARVARPIRRGKYWHVTSARKPQLTRHCKKVNFAFNVHQTQICYWASFARQHGAEIQSAALSLAAGLQLHLVPVEGLLKRRAPTDWGVQEFNGELNSVTVWLCSVSQEKRKKLLLQAPVQKSYFIGLDKAVYQRAEEAVTTLEEADIAAAAAAAAGGDASHDDSSKTTQEEEIAKHRVQVLNLKGSWTPSNRDVALTLYDGYVKSNNLKKNLSSEALMGFKVDKSQSPQKKARSLSGSSLPGTPSPLTKIQSGHAYSMLTKLVSESSTNFVAVHEEMSEPSVQREQLHGIVACRTDDITRKNWHVELYNSQVMLRGKETMGYVIVSAAKASLLACDHRLVWRGQQLKSKSTLMGSVEGMQYYATVDLSPMTSDDNTQWLSMEHILDASEPSKKEGIMGLVDMVGSGQSVGGVVSDTVGVGEMSSASVQLQRIISRCGCQFFYADYGEVEEKVLTEIPSPPGDEEADMMKKEEGVDCFTLIHYDLNICTNSLQYAMIIDIVNNLLLYVEPKKKELTEKLQNMKFKQQLASVEDQKTPILNGQNNLRELMLGMRRLERELFMIHRAPDEPLDDEELHSRSQDLEHQLEDCKEEINARSEELANMLSCLKESQLQSSILHRTTTAQKEAALVRRYEVCFKRGEWRMTEADGQIGIADLQLNNFLYTKANREDDSGFHQFELGWVKVTNLQPDAPYKEVVAPQQTFSDRQTALRILCKFKAPVGGISIKEHFEVNVVPMTIQLTARFYDAVSEFFFPGKEEPKEKEDELGCVDEEAILDQPAAAAASVTKGNKKRGEDAQLPPPPTRRNSRRNRGSFTLDDIDKMKARAAKNNMFLYIKIPEVPLRVSYKSEKEKHITNINDFHFLLPSLEYHNQTWTWHDFAMGMKADSKRVLISQAVKQKLHIKSRSLFGDSDKTEVQEEDEKARLLLGAKLFGTLEKHTKKNLFGKQSK